MKKLTCSILILILVTGCACGVKEEENFEQKTTCIDLIDNYVEDHGYQRVGLDGIFRNDEKNIIWDSASNVFTYNEEEKVYLLIYNDEIFKDGDFSKNLYDSLKVEYDFEALKSFSLTTYEELNTCDLKEIDETYIEKEID